MKLIWIIIVGLLLLILMSCFDKKPNKLDCDNLKNIEMFTINRFGAKKVLIESKRLKEEIYFKELNSFYITIIDGVTKPLNFKELPDDKYQRFDNYEGIEIQLKDEGMSIVNKITSSCNLTKFDQIVVVFAKEKNDGTLFYRFGNRYDI